MTYEQEQKRFRLLSDIQELDKAIVSGDNALSAKYKELKASKLDEIARLEGREEKEGTEVLGLTVEKEIYKCVCGKECNSNAGLKSHMRNCQQPQPEPEQSIL